MAESLSPRQAEVLALYVEAGKAVLPAPTIRDLCDELGVSSTNTIADHIKALIKKGWLERWERNASRALVLTNHARRTFGLPLLRRAA